MLVLEGQVRLTCGDHAVMLDAGDSCHYDGHVPHGFENCGTVGARVLIAAMPATLEPGVRAGIPVATVSATNGNGNGTTKGNGVPIGTMT